MSPDQITMVVMVSGFGLATAWAAWVSKTLVKTLVILSAMQGTTQRVDTLEDRVDDHETRIRGLEST